MKEKQYGWRWGLGLCCVLLLLAVPVSAQAGTVRLNKSKLSLNLGGTSTLSVRGTSEKAEWSSSNEKIATVSAKGKVSAEKPGTATITAKVGKKTLTCKVTVKNNSSSASALKFEVSGGQYFVKGVSTADIAFKLKKTSANVTVSVKNSGDQVVYKETFDLCKAGTTYKLTWKGKNAKNKSVAAGSYYVEVKAGKTKTASDYLTVITQPFAGGNGSKKNPFLVSSLEQLKLVAHYNGCYFKQTVDIDGNYAVFSPLYSDSTNPFTGTYDGDGYAIRNLTIQDSNVDKVALFGTIGEKGCLNEIQLSGISVIGANTGASVLAVTNYGKITNCTVSDSNVSGTAECISLLVGTNCEGAIISGCSVSGSAGACATTKPIAGGLAVENYGTIVDCTLSNSSLTTSGSNNWIYTSRIGGLVQYNKGQMRNCVASEVTCHETSGGITRRIGGICRLNEGTIIGCSFTGTAENAGVESQNGIFQ